MFGTFLTLICVFLAAYLSSDYMAVISINEYGEAHMEMALLVFFLMPLFLVTVMLSFLDWRREIKHGEGVSSNGILLRDLQGPDLGLPMEFVKCPKCRVRFLVSSPHLRRVISCPECGLTGGYEPDLADSPF